MGRNLSVRDLVNATAQPAPVRNTTRNTASTNLTHTQDQRPRQSNHPAVLSIVALGDVMKAVAGLSDEQTKLYYASHIIRIGVEGAINMYTNVPKTNGAGNGHATGGPLFGPLELITRLGDSFDKYATHFQVRIRSTAPIEYWCTTPTRLGCQDENGQLAYVGSYTKSQTTEFALIEQLVEKLSRVRFISSLDVILYNKNGTSTIPFTTEELWYALPFYTLRFRGWNLMTMADYLNSPNEMSPFTLFLLDTEYPKWIEHKEKDAIAAEAADRFARQVVKVTYSEFSAPPEPPLRRKAQPPKPAVNTKK
jgi:hypothetical protein